MWLFYLHAPGHCSRNPNKRRSPCRLRLSIQKWPGKLHLPATAPIRQTSSSGLHPSPRIMDLPACPPHIPPRRSPRLTKAFTHMFSSFRRAPASNSQTETLSSTTFFLFLMGSDSTLDSMKPDPARQCALTA